MKLSHWNLIISIRADISRLLERTLAVDSTRFGERLAALPVDPATLAHLHGELRGKLESLREALSRELTENETYLVMFPLVLLCDEMVMCRLAKEQQTSWSLLQSELFQINYGGDVFYGFVDERLDKPDTPPMVFEVLYFCLAAGFVGKFGESSGKVQRYRTLLTEQLAANSASPEERRRRRRAARKGGAARRSSKGQRQDPTDPAGAPDKSHGLSTLRARSWRSLLPYGAALAGLLLALGVVLLFTNL